MRYGTDGTGYSRAGMVQSRPPDEVLAVVERHLLGGRPVAAMLYPKFHLHL